MSHRSHLRHKLSLQPHNQSLVAHQLLEQRLLGQLLLKLVPLMFNNNNQPLVKLICKNLHSKACFQVVFLASLLVDLQISLEGLAHLNNPRDKYLKQGSVQLSEIQQRSHLLGKLLLALVLLRLISAVGFKELVQVLPPPIPLQQSQR